MRLTRDNKPHQHTKCVQSRGVEMQKYDTESYRWLLVACESSRLWNAHDHFWVEKVRANGALNSDEVKNFAYIYQTIRSTSEQSRLNVNNFITKNCNLNPKDIYIKSIQEDVSLALQGEKKNKKVRSNVFVSKLLWVYRPEEWCMHDTLSKIGLRKISGERFDDKNFHDGFNKIFHLRELTNIECLLKALDIRYDFKSRVADKYLMSVGQHIASKTHPPKPLDQDDWHKWVIDRHKGPKADIGAALEIAAKLPRMRG